MKIKVSIKQLFDNKENPKRAYVDAVFDESYVVHGIALYEKEERKYIVMPRSYWTNKQGKDMKRDLFHPISAEAWSQLQNAVFEAYEKALITRKILQKEVKE